METAVQRSKQQPEQGKTFRTAVRSVKSVKTRILKSKMQKGRKSQKQPVQKQPKFAPVSANRRGTKARSILDALRSTRSQSKELDITDALACVSDVDLQKYEAVWSFVKPATTREMKESRRKQVKRFVDDTLSKGCKGLVAEFRMVPKHDDLAEMSEFVAQNALKKNRYRDVGCLDTNRVILAVGKCTYIHANYVASPSNPRKYICTQGPLPHTCSEFWCMVVQEETKNIVMLCNLSEQNASKCAEYYPREAGEPMVFEGDITVQFKTKEMLKFPFETTAVIEVTTLEVSVPGFSMHSCSHYHWVDWPDRGVPPADMAPLYFLNQFSNSREPIVIHCSAGIGRTGSMVLLQYAMEVLEKGDVLKSMSVYLDEVRAQRSCSVQNEQQYLFVHQVLLNFLQKTGWLPQSLDPALEAFRKSYRKQTKGF